MTDGVPMRACFATASAATGFGPMLFAGRVREAVAVSSELGFDGIEISLRDPAELDRRELEAMLQESGLQLAAVASGRSYFEDGLSLTDPDAAGRGRAVERIVTLAEYAAAFGAPLIIGLVRGKAPADGDLDAACTRFVEGVCGVPRAHGRLRRPLHPSRPSTATRRRCSAPRAETLAAVERIGSPDVSVLLDVFHMNIEEVSIGAAIREAGARLGHFHLVDSNRRAAGMGHVDFAEVAAARP